ncbi:MAG: DUF2799 domain-containing protein [Terricaulis sp.]
MRLKLIAFAVLAAAVIGISGCETMSAEECAVADWRTLGFNDAAQSGADRLTDRSESCAEKGLLADANAYRSGFNDGMYEFCQPPRGFQFARRGGSFNGYCPAELDQPFRRAFSDGARVYSAEQALASARSEVSRLESRRNEIDDDIGSHERTIANPETTEERRQQMRRELEGLRRERRDVNDDIRTVQERVPQAQRLLDDLRYEIGGRWGSWN